MYGWNEKHYATCSDPYVRVSVCYSITPNTNNH